MRKITLLAPLALVALGFTLTSCGDKKSPESISFNSYSNEVSKEEFVAEYNKLSSKTIDTYTINTYSYDKYEVQYGDVKSYSLRENKETTKFDKNVKKYLNVEESYNYQVNPSGQTKNNHKKNYYVELEDDFENKSRYSRIYGTMYDSINMTYESYSIYYNDLFTEVNSSFSKYKYDFSSDIEAKYYVDDDLYTIVAKYKSSTNSNTNKKDITNVDSNSNGYKYEYKYQVKYSGNEILAKCELTDEYSYETTVDNEKTKYKYSNVAVYSTEYKLEAPVFDEIDKTKYINVD